MPARAIPNGQTVTLRLDADLVFQLKVAALQARVGLSEFCGPILAAAMNGESTPMPAIKASKAPGEEKVPQLPAIARSPSSRTTRGKRGRGDKGLFHLLQHHLEAGTIKQAELAKAVGVSPANIRASWMKTQWVPAKYVPAVLMFLESKGIFSA